MAQQTALSWYIEQHKILSSKTDDMPISELVVKIKDIEIQAKEMEKQQMEDEYKRGWEDATSTGVKESYKYLDRRSIN
jgi:hypothetical protein